MAKRLFEQSFIVMQVSRTALTFIAQKASNEPLPCKRCSQRLRDKDSGNSIDVYHGESTAAEMSCADMIHNWHTSHGLAST